MHDRAALGPADVQDDVLAGMVARLLGVDAVDLLSSSAVRFAYDLPAITTAGRYLVTGTAVADAQRRDFAFFVKHVQEWSRSPFFADVPEELREMARASVPWRTEAEVYSSALSARLPDGLTMPRPLGVHEIDESSYAVWLELVRTRDDGAWDLSRDREAAHLLGRFAASPQVREAAAGVSHPFTIRSYSEGRFKNQVLPMLLDEGIWHHPLVADAFGDLRDRMRAAAAGIDEVTEELLALPHLAGHGDACPNNLLLTDRDGFTLIDFGFFTLLPVGFDLGQLLVGDVQIGARAASDLAERDAAMLETYRDGLAAEGFEIEPAALRRAHALQLALFSGLSALPFELLGLEPTDELHALAGERAAIARLSLDLLDETAQARPVLG